MTAPADQASRIRLRNQLEDSVICLAGAGAGKTHELVQRMVECIRQGRCRIDEMVAITFTRKAAGELRGRFHEQLQFASQGTEQEKDADPQQIARLQLAVRHLDRCMIGTIHAFCARILRQFPAQAGLSADFHEVEEREEMWLARDAWDRFLEERSAAGDERLGAIEQTGLTAEQFYQFFLTRCQYSELPLKPTTQARPDLEGPTDQLRQFVEQVAEKIPTTLPDQPDRLMGTIQTLGHRFAFSLPHSDAERAFVLRSFDSSMATQVTLKRWGSPGSPAQALARSLRDDLVKGMRTQIIQPALSAWRRYVYTLAAQFVDEAMQYYRQHRWQHARLTFNDLMETTAELLRDHKQTRQDLQGRYRVIFVDEFQDTDPLQAQILLYLTGVETDLPWHELTPRRGSLFLVGDEKQSIYRFRRADVDVFRLMRQRLEAGDGKCIELTTTFRSGPALARWTNDTFEGLFEAQDLRFQTSFQRLRAQRPEPPVGGVYRLRSDPQRRGRAQQVEGEADKISQFIAAAIQGHTRLNGDEGVLGPRARPGDFMILTRTRRWLAQYGRSLEQRGIPYDITGAGSVKESVELRAIVDALDTILRPNDAVSVVATLRGVLFGFGDDELYAIKQADWTFHLDEQIPADLDVSLRQRLRGAIDSLHGLRFDLKRYPPAAALERFVDDSGLIAAAAAQESGSARAGNLLRLLSMVRDWQSRRSLSWVQIASQLRDLLEGGEFRIEEMTLETGRQDVVRVMNLHQAKGLEAKVVFLVDPTDTSAEQHGVDVHVSRLGDEPYLSMAVTSQGPRKPWVMAEPEGWQQDAELESRYLAAEQLRLVYVAATRAADVLVVGQGPTHSGPWKDLHLGLRDVEDLPIPQDVPVAQDESSHAAVDIAEHRATRQQRWAAVGRPSWESAAVADGHHQQPWESETRGDGQQYGVVVHRLLEHCVTGRLNPQDEKTIESLARALLSEQEVEEEDPMTAQATRDVMRFGESSLWEQIQDSAEVHAEVPYASASSLEQAMPKIDRGVIDLVFRAPQGWWLVDYKTQRLSTGDAKSWDRMTSALLAQYQPQLSAYIRHWQHVTQELVVVTGLWLTQDARWLAANVD